MQRATADDFAEVDALLRENGLPSLPSTPQSLELWVCREETRVVGAIGLELAERDGLLRSAVVASSHRGRGLGGELVRELVDAARGRGLEAVYLLTETAEPFFARLGFVKMSREAAPAGIRATEEFRTQCPDSATLMRLQVAGQDPSAGDAGV